MDRAAHTSDQQHELSVHQKHYQRYRESNIESSKRCQKSRYWGDEEYRKRKIESVLKRYYEKKAQRAASANSIEKA